jgi:hypothetical protein
MGQGNIDDVYRRLAKKIDGTTTLAPWNQTLFEILIRHGLSKEISRSEMTESIARSKELKLVLSADNVQKE